jgi:hypothetical protein
MRIGTPESPTPWLTIVGEMADLKLSSPNDPAKEQFFGPVDQAEEEIGSFASASDLNGNGGYIVLRSTLPPESMECALRSTVRAIDPQLPLTQVQTLEQAVSDSEAPRRFNTVLITSFGRAAVLLAVLGIYSVIAFMVASRVQEMAIPHGARFAARWNHPPDSGIRNETRCHRLHPWVGGGCGSLNPTAVHAVWSQPV